MADQQITAYHCVEQSAAALVRADRVGAEDGYYTRQLALAEGWRHLAETVAIPGSGIYPDAS